MNEGSSDARRTRPTLLLVIAALFTVALSYSVVLPVLPLILKRAGLPASGVSWHTGMLTGIYMLAVFVFAPFWGGLSDRVGRRSIIVLGLAGTTVGLLMFAGLHQLALFYVARTLTGASVAAVLTAGTAEIVDITPQSLHAHRFAKLTSASLVGFLAGPTLSWRVTAVASSGGGGNKDLYAPILIAAALSALAALITVLLLPRHERLARQHTKSVHPLLTVKNASPALLVLVVMFALTSFEVGITLHGQQHLGWTPFQTALFFAECSVVMIVVQGLLFALLLKYVPKLWLLGVGMGAMIVGLALAAVTDDYNRILMLVMLVSVGASVVAPMITYWASLGAGLAQGAALGAQTAASSLGQALGSAAVGALFGLSVAAPFWLAVALLIGGAALMISRGAGLRQLDGTS